MFCNIHTHQLRQGECTILWDGTHPWHAHLGLKSLTDPDSLDAIGEIGLDFSKGDHEQQQSIFIQELERAQRLRKGVVIHCVRAFEPVMNILKGRDLPFVIFHGFLGSPEQADRAIREGYYLSFGERTMRSPKTQLALRACPKENLFLETDESEVSIREIYRFAASERMCTIEELRLTVLENLNRILTQQI